MNRQENSLRYLITICVNYIDSNYQLGDMFV